MRRERLTVGIDVGGTNVRAGVVDPQGTVLAGVDAPTPRSDAALEACLERAVAELRASYEVAAVGLAVAGFLDRDASTVLFAPHLPWRGAPVRERMRSRLRLPVVLEQDANAALWAEYRFGAATGARVAAFVSIGTGIGSALLIGSQKSGAQKSGAQTAGSQLYRGAHGVAPELGHLRLVPDGRSCPCGKRGCWERYCSGTALVATALELLAADPARSTILARQHTADPGSLTGRRVVSAAREGDPLAVAATTDLAVWLGRGLVAVCDVYDPDLIVVGGGVSESSAVFLDEAREYCGRNATGSGWRPAARIRTAQLGEAAGLIGAAELAHAVPPG